MTKEEIEKLIIENEKLAYYVAHKFRFKCSFMDFEDLKSICILGLVKSANTFNVEKNINFSTYAIKCITNEVLLTLRKHSKISKEISLESLIYDNLSINDILPDDIDIENDFINSDNVKDMLQFIQKLPDNQKSVMKLSLNHNTQQEIAEILDISQPQVSRLYKQGLYNLRLQFERRDLDE